ncbi:hypothetical protein [Algihabitans albus]|uniref:hypothetical protein n=1 Tax=Algihabitans albus TaxID=2164067 RepID=UPI000E5CF1EF|nr:hypothetical protein [Algihabitans albus]
MQLPSLVKSILAASATVAVLMAPAAADDLKPVYLDAVIAEGATPLSDVSFTVERVQGGVVQEMRGGGAEMQLPAGRYRVRAAFGQTEVERDIVVDATNTRHTINLNAGEVQLNMIHGIGQDPIRDPIQWDVMTFGRDATGNRHLLHQVTASTAHLTLPGGWYYIEATHSGRTVKHTIEVTPGAAFKYFVMKQ